MIYAYVRMSRERERERDVSFSQVLMQQADVAPLRVGT